MAMNVPLKSLHCRPVDGVQWHRQGSCRGDRSRATFLSAFFFAVAASDTVAIGKGARSSRVGQGRAKCFIPTQTAILPSTGGDRKQFDLYLSLGWVAL